MEWTIGGEWTTGVKWTIAVEWPTGLTVTIEIECYLNNSIYLFHNIKNQNSFVILTESFDYGIHSILS